MKCNERNYRQKYNSVKEFMPLMSMVRLCTWGQTHSLPSYKGTANIREQRLNRRILLAKRYYQLLG